LSFTDPDIVLFIFMLSYIFECVYVFGFFWKGIKSVAGFF
jgi:hypothetical protein